MRLDSAVTEYEGNDGFDVDITVADMENSATVLLRCGHDADATRTGDFSWDAAHWEAFDAMTAFSAMMLLATAIYRAWCEDGLVPPSGTKDVYEVVKEIHGGKIHAGELH